MYKNINFNIIIYQLKRGFEPKIQIQPRQIDFFCEDIIKLKNACKQLKIMVPPSLNTIIGFYYITFENNKKFKAIYYEIRQLIN